MREKSTLGSGHALMNNKLAKWGLLFHQAKANSELKSNIIYLNENNGGTTRKISKQLFQKELDPVYREIFYQNVQ